MSAPAAAASPLSRVRWVHYAQLSYARSWALQRAAAARGANVVISQEHFAVVTLGRTVAASADVQLAAAPGGDSALPPPPPPPPVYRVERGGRATWHGPGQLVVYPLLDLSRPPLRRDLRWYVRGVEATVAAALAALGLPGAAAEPANPGVWLRGSKIAAVGMSARGWRTGHGFALNVAPDLAHFRAAVVPCGLADRQVTSVLQELLRPLAAPQPPALNPPAAPPTCDGCGGDAGLATAAGTAAVTSSDAPPAAAAAAAALTRGAALRAVQDAFAAQFGLDIERRHYCTQCRAPHAPGGAATEAAAAAACVELTEAAIAGVAVDDLLADFDLG